MEARMVGDGFGSIHDSPTEPASEGRPPRGEAFRTPRAGAHSGGQGWPVFGTASAARSVRSSVRRDEPRWSGEDFDLSFSRNSSRNEPASTLILARGPGGAEGTSRPLNKRIGMG